MQCFSFNICKYDRCSKSAVREEFTSVGTHNDVEPKYTLLTVMAIIGFLVRSSKDTWMPFWEVFELWSFLQVNMKTGVYGENAIAISKVILSRLSGTNFKVTDAYFTRDDVSSALLRWIQLDLQLIWVPQNDSNCHASNVINWN